MSAPCSAALLTSCWQTILAPNRTYRMRQEAVQPASSEIFSYDGGSFFETDRKANATVKKEEGETS